MFSIFILVFHLFIQAIPRSHIFTDTDTRKVELLIVAHIMLKIAEINKIRA